MGCDAHHPWKITIQHRIHFADSQMQIARIPDLSELAREACVIQGGILS